MGAPDCVWSFSNDFHITFEAKTEKSPDGRLAKKDVQKAKGHPDWVKANVSQNPATAEIVPTIVAPSSDLDEIAVPFADNLFYLSPERIRRLAEDVSERVRKLRLSFGGRDFPDAAVEFSSELRNLGLDLESLKRTLLSDLLKK